MNTSLYVVAAGASAAFIFLYGYEMGRLQGETKVYWEWIEANMRRLR